MEVPCCGGLVGVAEEAMRQAGTDVPLRVCIAKIGGGVQS
jgi:hypothetical protein